MDLSHKEKEKKWGGNRSNSSGKKMKYKNKKNTSIEDIKSNESNDKKEINNLQENNENNDLNVDYEKNVTISEACRGLSDVILDFRVYLMKYFLKKKKINK